jgi:hypothetical protein
MVLISVAAAGGGGGGGGGEVHTQIGPYTIHNRDKQGSRESTIHKESQGLKLMFSSHSQNDDERRPCVARLFLTSGKGVFFFSVCLLGFTYRLEFRTVIQYEYVTFPLRVYRTERKGKASQRLGCQQGVSFQRPPLSPKRSILAQPQRTGRESSAAQSTEAEA